MSNPLFNMFGSGQMQNQGINDIVAQINNFRANVKGNPQQMVQDLLNSGKMTQAQFNQLSQMANQIMGMIK